VDLARHDPWQHHQCAVLELKQGHFTSEAATVVATISCASATYSLLTYWAAGPVLNSDLVFHLGIRERSALAYKKKTRVKLLVTARWSFAQRTFYSASIATISAQLGLTKQALLHHLGSKDKL